MEWLEQALDILRNLKPHLQDWSASMGPWFYVLLFAIVFAETGLVVTPFLPGDSLLFAIGAIASGEDSRISVPTVIAVLCAAAILGDAVNYSIGYRLGPRVFTSSTSRLLNRKHLFRAQEFYERHGGKTIVLARFVPIVRTFAPFVAGIGRMSYPRFALYNVGGGVAWVVLLVLAGVRFGAIPWVERNFESVVVAIVVISVLPVVFEWWRARRAAARA